MTRFVVCIAALMLSPAVAFGEPRVATPTFSAHGGEYSTLVMVTVRVATAGATIRFTQNGFDPTLSDPIITSGSTIAVNTSMTLKARAFMHGRRPSDVRTATFTIVSAEAGAASGAGDIAAGGARSLLATPDGRVFAWTRDETPEQIDGLPPIVSIAAGEAHALALTSDGRVYAWGANHAGQLGDGTHVRRTQPIAVTGLSDVVTRIAAGRNHSLALTADGRVWVWGSNNHGQLGAASAQHSSAPVLIEPLADIVAIEAGDSHSVALTGAGTVFVWGANDHGQIGDGSREARQTPTPVELDDVVAVAAGAAHTLAMKGDGSVYAWGSGSRGELGTGSLDSVTRPTEIVGLQAYAVRAGRQFSAAVRRDGALMMWGANDAGQLGDGSDADRSTPVAGPSIVSVSALALGARHALAVTATGDVWTWGADRPLSETLSDVPDWGPPFLPETLAAPVIEPAGGSYPSAQTVTLSTSTDDVIVRYTLDGSEPTEASAVYSAPLTISSSAVLRARAYSPRTEVEPSQVASAAYIIDVSPPTILLHVSPEATTDWFVSPVTVTFQCADDSGTVSCPPPVIVSHDGASQLISGTAIDPAGNRTTASVTVSVDLTPPSVVLNDSPDNSTTTAAELVLTGRVTDSASGLADSVRCNGSAAPVVHDTFECEVALRPGRNTVTLQAVDVAGHVTAAGVVVTRVGDAASIAIAPDSRTMAVNELATLSLHDDFGATVTGAAWSSSDLTIATLSEDDPPVVTAVAAGTATIRAVKGDLSAEATVTVDSASVLADGTTRWTIPPTPGLTMEPPIFTHRVEPDVPDMFVVERAAFGEATLRAVSSEGEVLWKQHAPGVPLMGDSFGGVIVGAPFGLQLDFFGALIRLGNAGGVRPWRYESGGALARPAQSPDGTIYVVENIHGQGPDGDDLWDKHVLVIDGKTGRMIARRPLAREVEVFTAELDGQVVREKPLLVCASNRKEAAPATMGPVVGSDGRGYLLVRRLFKHKFDTCLEQQARHRRTISHGIDLVILSADAAPVVRPIFEDACDVPAFQASPCDVRPDPKQLVPDGIGGILASWDRFGTFVSNTTALLQRVVSRLDEHGTLVATEVANTTWIDTIGQAGISYVFASGAWSAVDVTSWTPKWTTNLGTFSPLAAHPDGGLSVFDHSAQTYKSVDAAGGMDPGVGSSVPLRWPVHEFGSWIGVAARGLTSIVGKLDDATRWAGIWGNRQGQSAGRRPGIGLFAKGHHITSAVPLWMHSSLRITPADAAYWTQHPRFGSLFREFTGADGTIHRAVDVFGNPSATIGGGPYAPNGEDTTLFCLANSILEGTPNRPTDQLIPPIYFQRLALRGSENWFIERLFDLDSKYGDFLKYECIPDDFDEFNSNSYLSGLLGAADIVKPWFPQSLPLLFPGWSKPVPARYFGQ